MVDVNVVLELSMSHTKFNLNDSVVVRTRENKSKTTYLISHIIVFPTLFYLDPNIDTSVATAINRDWVRNY